MDDAVTQLEKLANMGRMAEVDALAQHNAVSRTDELFADPEGGRQVPADERADFDTASALATGVGASLVFGPAGLLLGVAQGVLGQRAEQQILDESTAARQVVASAVDTLQDEVDLLPTETQGDREFLGTVAGDMRRIREMTGNPRTLGAAGALSQQVRERVRGRLGALEAQRINDAALQEQRAIELNTQQQALYERDYDRFNKGSENYVKTASAVTLADRALVSGNPAQQQAAIVLLNKALDPSSVVRSEEAKAFAEMGSILEQGRSIIRGIENGQILTQDQAVFMQDLLRQIHAVNEETQHAHEGFYQQRLADADMPLKYHDDFNFTNRGPKPTFGEIAYPDAYADKIGAEREIPEGVPSKVGYTDTRDEGWPTFMEDPAQWAADKTYEGRPGLIRRADGMWIDTNKTDLQGNPLPTNYGGDPQ
jgi:hypothetical protein